MDATTVDTWTRQKFTSHVIGLAGRVIGRTTFLEDGELRGYTVAALEESLKRLGAIAEGHALRLPATAKAIVPRAAASVAAARAPAATPPLAAAPAPATPKPAPPSHTHAELSSRVAALSRYTSHGRGALAGHLVQGSMTISECIGVLKAAAPEISKHLTWSEIYASRRAAAGHGDAGATLDVGKHLPQRQLATPAQIFERRRREVAQRR